MPCFPGYQAVVFLRLEHRVGQERGGEYAKLSVLWKARNKEVRKESSNWMRLFGGGGWVPCTISRAEENRKPGIPSKSCVRFRSFTEIEGVSAGVLDLRCVAASCTQPDFRKTIIGDHAYLDPELLCGLSLRMFQVIGKEHRVDDAMNRCGDAQLFSESDDGAVQGLNFQGFFPHQVKVHR